MWEAADWYEEAFAYDVVFDHDTPREADFIEAMAERHGRGRSAQAALEPACGTGRLVVEMARRGWRTVGYDLSEGSMAYARERLAAEGLRATIRRGAMQRFGCRQRFDIAWNFVSTFKYLLTEGDARSHLQRTADMLRPGGLYLLGVHVTDYADRGLSRERWVGRRDGATVTAVIQSSPARRRERTEAMRARIRIERGGNERRFETHWTFRSYGPRQLASLLRSVPDLERVAVHDFTYDPEREVAFGGEQLDHLLVLRRRG
ncbi:MAG: class I SAM-dependent methyltransferase [Phycisphaerales bacterium]